ncbi:iron ABC transporter ATP-binding protein [Desulfuromonas versatilis]|uniref:Iron ABC transporter ATP-binding protein n=1 Tax=Desulfuromonas versatilis TaxID=2802975 RepID=A0ABM8HT37_9BACT|nr:ABC transporter ATP-binding protein [Desulfuromonas versatilis]BCR03855.1 iron ABC transporter ATP-binding protein [Desulfuromonas versatilis]
MTDNILELDGISQAYGQHLVVKNLSLRLVKGQIGCLLGESGCGKTTVLRTIAGFEPLLAGQIRLAGQEVSRPGWSLPPAKRAIGMVFQDYALFPHLTIFDNVAFGLKGLDRAAKVIRVNEMLELVGLGGSQAKYPHEISGGQQQRVALARALAPRPNLLLMDEPFSNLDVTLRERLSMEVRDILKAYGATALFVTHNQQEAFAVADQIGVMRDGTLLQWSNGHQLYHHPADPGVARFVGEGVLLPGVVRSERQVETGLGMLNGSFSAPCSGGCAVDVLVRPEDVVHDDASPVKAEVVRRYFRGANVLYSLRLASGDLVQALVPSHCDHAPGEKIGIRQDVRHIVLFPKGG